MLTEGGRVKVPKVIGAAEICVVPAAEPSVIHSCGLLEVGSARKTARPSPRAEISRGLLPPEAEMSLTR